MTNNHGLWIAVALAMAIGVAFAVDPSLDIAVSRLFAGAQNDFPLGRSTTIQFLRETAMWMARAAIVPAVAAIILKLVFPRMRALIAGRAAVLLIATLALGPGLLVNGILKEHWGRPRPSQTVEFRGQNPFMPWYDHRGACPTNCSFVSGDVATGFWTIALAAVTPGPFRAAAFVAALSFGVAIAVMRMVVGAHFFTDVAFAGLFTYFVIWIVYGLLYRWRATRVDDEAIEQRLATAGLAIRATLAMLAARVTRLVFGATRSR